MRSVFLLLLLSASANAEVASISHPGADSELTGNIGILMRGDSGHLVVEIMDAVNSARPDLNPIPEIGAAAPSRATKFNNFEVRSGDSTEAKLSRYIVLRFASDSDLASIARELANSPRIEHVAMEAAVRPAAAETCHHVDLGLQQWSETDYPKNWGSEAVRVLDAQDLQRGHAYVGIVDTGIDMSNDIHRAFDVSTGAYLAGNFLPNLSYDAGKTTSTPYVIMALPGEVDDYKVKTLPSDTNQCDANLTAPFAPNGYHEIRYSGHGTHVAGILAANGDNGTIDGVCKNCPLSIARYPGIFDTECTPQYESDTSLYSEMYFNFGYFRIAAAMEIAGNIGVQVVNFSGGFNFPAADVCGGSPNDVWCLAIQYLHELDVIIAAASGNEDRPDRANFPARDSRVWSVGGIVPLGSNPPTRWSDVYQPGSVVCGSNYGSDTVDFVAPAVGVYSTMPNKAWWVKSGCHEYNDGTPNDKFGYCTGTSMATPFLSGIAALVRSTNPLALKADVFEAVRRSTGASHTQQLGHGLPMADSAVKEMLGKTNGVDVSNRATPLFNLNGVHAQDYVNTTKPQVALAFFRNTTWGYIGDTASAVVGGYTFPQSGIPVLSPRADAFILTTHVNPYDISGAELLPLYRMRYIGAVTGNPLNADAALVEPSRIGDFASVGYKMEGIEGYIYPPCTPQPACIPAGAVKLWRGYNSSKDDHAVFPQSRYFSMRVAGYSTQLTMLGYAYPNVDSDSDGLINAWELQIGTDSNNADSDCDGVDDGDEYPPFGRPVSDPLLPYQC